MQSPAVPPLSNRQVVWATLSIAGVALCFWLVYRFHETILLLIAGIIIAIAVRPIVKRLHKFGVPQSLGVAFVYLALFAALVLFALFGIPLVASQSATIVERVQEFYGEFHAFLLTTDNFFLRRLLQTLPETLSAPASGGASTDALTNVNEGFVLIGSVVGALFKILATLGMAFFWTVESERIKLVLLQLVPIHKRADAREGINEVEDMVGSFTVGQGILMAIIGVAQGIVYFAIGLPYAFILALIAGIAEAVPLIGPLIGTIPAVLVALTISPTMALIVLAASVVIQQVENTFLVPRIMGNTVGAAPIPTMLAFIAFSSLFGLIGALITVPVTAALQMALQRTVFARAATHQALEKGGRTRVSLARYELDNLIQDIRGQIRKKSVVATADSDKIEDSIEAIALDLDSILGQVEQVEQQAQGEQP